jgi:NAD(P)-dependent dehydrogenase (short-subunit alcohol dehydrogenase family)
MGQLDGKVAVVTGATSGIGDRIAELFVAEGASVVAAGRRTDEGSALEVRCGGNLSFIRTDVSVEADVKAMIDHAVSRFGRLDCLSTTRAPVRRWSVLPRLRRNSSTAYLPST